MKHDFYDPRPNGPELLLGPPTRQCRNCGKKQELNVEWEWMRIVSRRWLPLIGRCKPIQQES